MAALLGLLDMPTDWRVPCMIVAQLENIVKIERANRVEDFLIIVIGIPYILLIFTHPFLNLRMI